ncbi:hypothetical protein [Homoserinimonas sp. OAct 916]|uniref:hypothetical protein n=1 Tax=Homoserinimonas sp. OAct 916 TaxID=2211450 RepID=UPI00130071B8|nr:hypothetical protein [Homoserinimonas sp. OAct 916]
MPLNGGRGGKGIGSGSPPSRRIAGSSPGPRTAPTGTHSAPIPAGGGIGLNTAEISTEVVDRSVNSTITSASSVAAHFTEPV